MIMWNSRKMDIKISVDIPALSELVGYLREKDKQPEIVAALTKRVREATAKVRTSTAALESAVNQQTTTETEKESDSCHSTN